MEAAENNCSYQPENPSLLNQIQVHQPCFQVYKEHEMEIGHPTDVKHVAHIGWDGGSMNAPSWMNEFKSVSDFSTAALNNFGQSRDPSCVAVARWAVPDSQQSAGLPHSAEIFLDPHRMELPENPPKQSKRRKPKSPSSLSKAKRSSSNRSSSSSSSSLKHSKPKASLTLGQGEVI